MEHSTIRLTMAQALVRWLTAQVTEIDDQRVPLLAGVFGIFGHGNVTCLSEALEAVQDKLPTWRGQNEQWMALAAVGFAKAKRRRQIMIATSSIGPGALNMVTAAGTTHANRLSVLLISGDTFSIRLPDPVLQQVEHCNNPTITVNDAFRAVTRYRDRITHPAQIIQSLPQAVGAMLWTPPIAARPSSPCRRTRRSWPSTIRLRSLRNGFGRSRVRARIAMRWRMPQPF